MYSAVANIIESEEMTLHLENNDTAVDSVKNLTEAKISEECIIKGIRTDDQELTNFLFTLGCFKGESVTIISKLAENYVITVKDARYSIDADLAEAIMI